MTLNLHRSFPTENGLAWKKKVTDYAYYKRILYDYVTGKIRVGGFRALRYLSFLFVCPKYIFVKCREQIQAFLAVNDSKCANCREISCHMIRFQVEFTPAHYTVHYQNGVEQRLAMLFHRCTVQPYCKVSALISLWYRQVWQVYQANLPGMGRTWARWGWRWQWKEAFRRRGTKCLFANCVSSLDD